MRYSNPALSDPAFGNFEDWQSLRPDRHHLAHLQPRIWHLRKLGFSNHSCYRADPVQNLVHFDHSVLKAFSPYFAGAFFMRNKTSGWKSLGGILLAFTGVEALFADLGAFTRRYDDA